MRRGAPPFGTPVTEEMVGARVRGRDDPHADLMCRVTGLHSPALFQGAMMRPPFCAWCSVPLTPRPPDAQEATALGLAQAQVIVSAGAKHRLDGLIERSRDWCRYGRRRQT